MRAVLLDLDGTVFEQGEPVPGAAEAIAALRRAGLPLLFATNTTRRPRAAVARLLEGMGIAVHAQEIYTAPRAAAAWLEDHGAERVAPLLVEATLQDLPGFEVDYESPDFVVVGDLGSDWDYGVLNRAFRALLAGAGLLAVQRNRYWRNDAGELSLDAGPFVAALEYASGKTATLVGKPARAFFRGAVTQLGTAAGRVAMVGDDLEGDVTGARKAGLVGVAVRTGKFRPGDEDAAREAADVVLGSVAELPGWLGI